MNNLMIVPAKDAESSNWLPQRTFSAYLHVSRADKPVKVDKALLVKRSASVANFLQANPNGDLHDLFHQIGVDNDIMELVARFCHGFEVHMSSENIISLIYTSHQLKMKDTHCPNNLLNKALDYFRQEVLPSWDQTIRSLRATSNAIFYQAAKIGLLDHCMDALSAHALADLSLLGQPIVTDSCQKPNYEYKDNHLRYRSMSARRRLFGGDTASEDLTSLPLNVYAMIIKSMTQHRVPQEYIAGSLYRYLQCHGSTNPKELIEAIENLLPSTINKQVIFEMYDMAMDCGAVLGCISGIEARIGRILDHISCEELLALELDVESLQRVLKGYYGNYAEHDSSGLVAVSELMEEYLIKVVEEKEISASSFLGVAQMVTTTISVGFDRYHDKIYRAVDMYLEKHRELSESEKEEVCSVLDFDKMSAVASEHAALNQRLPLRLVVQALFRSQLQLRDQMTQVFGQYKCNGLDIEEDRLEKADWKEEEEDEEWCDETRQIGVHDKNCCEKKCRHKKVSLWKEVKRKLGCMGSSSKYESLQDSNCPCQVKRRKKLHYK